MSSLHAHLGVNRFVSSDGDTVIFDTLDSAVSANVTLNVSTGQFTVSAGLWLISCCVSTSHTTAANRRFHLYDITNSVEVPGTEIMTANATAGSNTGGASLMARVILLTTPTVYEIQLSHTASVTALADFSHLDIRKLN